MSNGLDRPAQKPYDPKRKGFGSGKDFLLKALWVAARGAFLLRVWAGCTGSKQQVQGAKE